MLQAVHPPATATLSAAHESTHRIGSRIDVQGVTRTFGRTTVLDKLSLSIEPGEFLTLLGPSGSGKTTLLGMIAGFQPVDAGEIHVDGKPIQNVPAHQRGFGMVFQNYALFPHMTVAQNIAFPLRMSGVGRGASDKRVAEVLEILRLSDHAQKLPTQLSGGQQQRVAIGRAIVKRPKVVLMDEPLSALDRRLRESTLVEIRELHRTLGMTIIFVTHDQGEALALSDRIAVLDAGRIVQLGTPAELYRRPANKFVAGFVGESNLIDVEVLECGGLTAVVQDGAGYRFDVALDGSPLPHGPAHVLVRPERVQIVPAGTPRALKAAVVDAVFLGEILRIDIRLASGAMLQIRSMDRDHHSTPRIGDEIHVAWSASDCWVIR
jgi:putative spermidine/putrescine transport system ATP-binding protein